MLRSLILSSAAALVLATTPAASQFREGDPVDLEEVLEEMLRAPYYGTTSNGFGRAQRPVVDQVPQKILSGTGYYYTDASYFRGIGKVLTDTNDITLYATSLDRDHEVSSVSGEALNKWRPLVIPERTRFSGLWGRAWNAELEAWVLTLAGKPLYRFIGDEEPGEANGVGGAWYILEVIG
ncbi:hypothetical protein [Minwuia sp.]|uniref:hypothetical protein n=1 Tax=Minwuia sp. TaxID=2493630 RepID=UPI003A94B488